MSRRRTRFVGLVAVALAMSGLSVATASAAKPPPKVLFQQDTPGTYSWTVPKGVRRVAFTLYGAAGGHSGGLGGKASATFQVVPGEVFEIHVGGQGAESVTGGSNGGGDGASLGDDHGGGGGGATDVRAGSCAATTSCTPWDRVLVAGGGGGGATSGSTTNNGGSGGGSVGGTGQEAGGAAAGQGGTATSGGDSGGNAGDGSFGSGGSWSPTCVSLCGGGGGGWFGGGAGYNGGGGGGGSGFFSGLALSGTMETGVQTGDGLVVITKG